MNEAERAQKRLNNCTVYVGAEEVTDYYMPFNKAVKVADKFIDDGYLDTAIRYYTDEYREGYIDYIYSTQGIWTPEFLT